jgi:hypothetical protein
MKHWGTASPILNLGTRGGYSSTSGFGLVRKIPQSLLNKGMDGLHMHSRRFEDQKNLEIEPSFLGRPPHSLVTIHSTICYILTLLNIHVLPACVAFFEQKQFKGHAVH